MPDLRSPKDTFITVYGRKPVLEALDDIDLRVDKVILAEGLRGEPIRAILDAARDRGIPVQRASAHRVKVLAGNGRHDQGVLADVVAPQMRPVAEFVEALAPDAPAAVLVLDRVTNPANVGMILRSATAAGVDGVLLARRGVPAIDPLVVKASAGVAFRAPVLRSGTVEEGCEALRAAGFAVYGLDAGGGSLLDAAGGPGAGQRDRRALGVGAPAARRRAGHPDARRRGIPGGGKRGSSGCVRAGPPPPLNPADQGADVAPEDPLTTSVP